MRTLWLPRASHGVGLRVRIRFAPAASLRTVSPFSGTERFFLIPRESDGGHGRWREELWKSSGVKSLGRMGGGTAPGSCAENLFSEQLGGPRNWDYRFCWLRDATLTLYAFLNSGFFEEAAASRDWLLRVSPGRHRRCRSCTGSPGSAAWSSRRRPGSRVTRVPHRFGSAMPRPSRFSSTFMARC
jgi:hypothetical protein